MFPAILAACPFFLLTVGQILSWYKLASRFVAFRGAKPTDAI